MMDASTQRASARTEETNRESNASPKIIMYKIKRMVK